VAARIVARSIPAKLKSQRESPRRSPEPDVQSTLGLSRPTRPTLTSGVPRPLVSADTLRATIPCRTP
jgi:hypothetical protein